MTGNELIPNPQDRIVCVKVGKVKRESFYEMARKYWVVKLERASKATHVLAIVNGIVDTVYIPEKVDALKRPRERAQMRIHRHRGSHV
jgi:hypothetical protein